MTNTDPVTDKTTSALLNPTHPTGREGLVGLEKLKGSSGCSDHEMAAFRFLKGEGRQKARTQPCI